ncbi:NADH-cytochrome b5 reductase [Coprinopsis cinerea okayama7|uniref:NADH-cytochrome b5 reductase n=1 Tax=Coprinopsis cinerea (strain Okayama-7 / 130 / ATCC MYA-4618 / FGSC 9003) TaxID=240176 RepID=A8NWI5_COPC7|nr:NADH-cytochrome b5 reductase [Coprinopsis cinerea okayama7\|eukprot:XP_001836901.2 NADH-cytochrome b5 reductase [Coprinopsis cinerea okayama7\
MQRLAVRCVQGPLRALGPSRYLSTTPPPPSRSKRLVTGSIFALTLTGASLYFLLPSDTRSAPTYTELPLSPRYFTPATVVSNLDSGPDTKLLRLALPPQVAAFAAQDPSSFKAVWSVFIKDDDIQVERPYTPLEGIDENGEMVFWIKKYPRGEVGRWLHTKAAGDVIELRGPLTTWPWKDDTWDEVVMISGGTGFTPFYQLFHSIISNPSLSPSTQFTFLHSSRTPEELPPASLLNPLITFAQENPARLKVNLFVDQNESKSSGYDLSVTRINADVIKRSIGLDKEGKSWWNWLYGKKPEAPKRRLFLDGSSDSGSIWA